ncbi:hypothetical protein EPN16_06375 [bacterium]|nr:MAG: hypothetical protein EPN16_06375 [bacterium]
MITKNTVFILGAGASADFGFPLGEELREKIYSNLLKNVAYVTSLAQALAGAWPDEANEYKRAIAKFAEALRHALDYSIDAFLERFQTTYLKIGKLAIAQALVDSENHDKLFEKDNWYKILVNEMKNGATIDNFHQNKVSFVTFNYDRSLEHLLYTVLCNFHEKANQSWAANVIKRIPIVHLYGKLDSLPWETSEPDKGRTYGRPYSHAQLKEYNNGIGIVFEDIGEGTKSNFEKASALLEAAERIYILGFGFDPENTLRLGLDKLINRKKIVHATSYELNAQRMGHLLDKLVNIRTFTPGNMEKDFSDGLGLYPVKAYTFLKEIADLR